MKLTFLAAGLTLLGQATQVQAQGLEFGSPVVAENFSGLAPSHTQEPSLRPGRIVVDTDPNRIRSGQTSVRMQIQPGDCGARIGGGQPDDCANGNERIEINGGTSAGTTLYAFSMMLGSDFRDLSEDTPSVDLVQWFQQNAGACFSLQYDVSSEHLSIRNRCTNGSYNTADPEDIELRRVPPFDAWNEFVVLSNWSKGPDGLFRVLVNNELAYDFRGPTLAAEGADEVSQRFTVLRYDGLGTQASTSTLWLDDVVQSGGLAEIEQRYAFDRGTLGVQ